jgi:hypothetical protein
MIDRTTWPISHGASAAARSRLDGERETFPCATADLTQLALGWIPPWILKACAFDAEARGLDIEIDFARAAASRGRDGQYGRSVRR